MSEATLTPEQQTIVDADVTGPWLVDAGAGTGKTFTLVKRAAALVRRGALRADELLVVTFTNAAAAEIADRLEVELGGLESELGGSLTRRPTCGTFHGVAGDLLREFAYAAGTSPDIRIIDDGRARGVFARAFSDLVHGKLNVDLSAFPLLDRTKTLERRLAKMVLELKQRDCDVSDVMTRAHAAAATLESLSFGAVQKLPKRGASLKGWPQPNPPRSATERREEAAHERANVAVVAALYARFQELLDAENLLTFGDVVASATRMIARDPSIAATLRARWKHAIVDEFQDTNDTQIRFLEALFGPALEPVMAVGDVRQAIYEFAGAKPQGIIEFRARAKKSLPLTENRRSLQPILDVAHSVLATHGGMPAELNAPLSAQRGTAPPLCVRFEVFSGADALDGEAACVAATIRTLVDRGVSPRDCAVLLRTRTRANVFAEALRARGFAVQLVGGVGFFGAAEVREVAGWLRLVDDASDPYAVVATLQGSAIGLSDGSVALLARGGNLPRAALLDAIPSEFSANERQRLERFRRVARVVSPLVDAPLVDAVRSVVTACGAEVAWLADPIALPQVRANLDKFVRFATDFAADRPLARIADLIEELRERDELELDLPLAEVEDERVAIMTIHGAKGLEWDHVFLVDVVPSSFPLVNTDNRDKVAQFDGESGALALKHGTDGRLTLRWFLTELPHDAAGMFLERKTPSREEEFRLLYVALTRARDAVYVTGRVRRSSWVSKCIEAMKQWFSSIGSSIERHALSLLHAQADAALALRTADARLHASLAERIARASVAPSRAIRRGTLSYTAIDLNGRCPRRARYRYVLGLPDLTDEAPPPPDAVDDDPPRETSDPGRYGRVVHKVLELAAKARIASEALALERALDDACAEEQWVPSLAERRGLERAIGAALGRLESLEPIDAERRFDFELDGVPLGGFIDLLARDAAGTVFVIDYKTGRAPSADYALQFALYLRAVRAQFPDAGARLLRVGDGTASFEDVVPALEAELRDAIAGAATMASDEPRPGAQCTYCPYAHDVCDAATLVPEAAAGFTLRRH